jgi:hypothetical protein
VERVALYGDLFLQALSGLYSAPDTPDWRDRSRRLVGLLMDGLRTVPKKR